jgi:Tfp pilus assembly PilM family ATPase
MGARAVGLDIGVEQVKAVALQKRRHQCILTGIGLSTIPQRANDEAVAQAVKAALREAGAGKSAAICAAVGGPSVVVKGIQLPRTPLPRVLDAVRWSFQEHGLLPSAGAVLDAQVLRTSDEGQMHIMAVCVPQDLVDRRLRLLTRAGVTPQKMDVQPLALLNAILALQEVDTDETLVLLSLASEAALICVYNAAAGAPLIRYLHAEHESAAEMLGEIRTAVTYFQSQLAEVSTLRFVYCGPKSIFGELQAGLPELLALWNQRDDPMLFDPLTRLEGAQRFLPADTSVEGSQFAPAVGLAMRAL